MPYAFRIVDERWIDSSLSGEGAAKYGGRWNNIGNAVVYASESRALATLEMLANLAERRPVGLLILECEFPRNLVSGVAVGELPADWRSSPPPDAVREVGDRWITEMRSAVLRVPSALIPEEFNYLLNPVHPDFSKVAFHPPKRFVVDARLA